MIKYIKTKPAIFSIFLVRQSLMSLALIFGFSFQSAKAQEIFELDSEPAVKKQAQGLQEVKKQAIQAFPTIDLLEQYQGESARGVRYLNSEERKQYLLHVCGALLCDQHGKAINHQTPAPAHKLTQFPETLSKSKEKLDFYKLGVAIYVMNQAGEIWLSFDAQPKVFHHSTLLAGQAVAAAGEMVIFEGRLYAINNRSGHYQPPPIVIKRVLSVLESKGISTQDILIQRLGSDF